MALPVSGERPMMAKKPPVIKEKKKEKKVMG